MSGVRAYRDGRTPEVIVTPSGDIPARWPRRLAFPRTGLNPPRAGPALGAFEAEDYRDRGSSFST
jgi:hypothetical protein